MKNKFLLVLIVILLILFTFITSVFGYYNDTVTYNDLSIDLSRLGATNNCAYILMYNKNENRFETLHPFGDSCSGNLDSIFYRNLNDNNSVTIYGINGFRNVTIETISIEDGTYQIGSLVSSFYSPNGVEISLLDYDFIGSNVPIYTDNSCSSLATDFFQASPQGITATLVEEAMKAKILEQLKIMIVGFLKYLIVFVISVIAFWKGWQFLSMQLKKA